MSLRTSPRRRYSGSVPTEQIAAQSTEPPGTAIVSSVAPPATGGTPDGYLAYDGTSMASPHVAGAAALVWSAHPGWSAGKVRGALIRTATDIGAPGPDERSGHGKLNAAAALAYDPIDDDDDDDDTVADVWDADPDDPSRWRLAGLDGAGVVGATRVRVQLTDVFGLFEFGYLTVRSPSTQMFALLPSSVSAGTSASGATLKGAGYVFGSSGLSVRPFDLMIVDDSDGDRLRLAVGGELLADGAIESGAFVVTGD